MLPSNEVSPKQHLQDDELELYMEPLTADFPQKTRLPFAFCVLEDHSYGD